MKAVKEAKAKDARKKSKTDSRSKKDVDKTSSASPQAGNTLRLIIGCFFALAGIYTLLGLTSYLFTWSIDQSLLSQDAAWTTLVDVKNLGGKLGFAWSDLLVGRFFGIGAFIIPFFLLAIAVYCLRIRKVRILPLFLLSAFGCILLSVTITYICNFTGWNRLFGNGPGGTYGYYVNDWLRNMLGVSGTGLLLLFLCLSYLAICSYRFVRFVMDRPRRKPQPVSDTDPQDDVPLPFPDSESVQAEGNAPLPSEDDTPDLLVAPASMDSVEEEDATPVADTPDNMPKFELEDSSNPVTPEPQAEEEVPEEVPLYNPGLDLPHYEFPSLDLLEDYADKQRPVTKEEWERNNIRITETLRQYKISIEKIVAVPGPTVTLYKIVLSPGIRISQVRRLEDDIAMSLAARGVRVIAPIPGTNCVGIEVANEHPSVVSMRSVLDTQKFRESRYDLPIALGKTISNEVFTFDLAKMPHLLVAGATGQGKSVGLNAIITSLLYKMHPAYLKFVLVDPKKVELSLYSRLERHFLAKMPDADEAIITDTKKVVRTLKSLCAEMDDRYNLLKMAGVRTIKEYNEKYLNRRLNPEKGHHFMPFIVVIVDEFSDLIITAGREVEEPLTRLAQLARAIGIHLVIATQRPTTNIITGTIKANFPARIAFRVISNVDSRTILDVTGANQLVGKGDLLISTGSDMMRLQCAFVDTPEVERIVNFIGGQMGYPGTFLLPDVAEQTEETAGAALDGVRDELFAEAARMVVSAGVGSTSLLQRKMTLGYNRAGRIMDQLEAAGIVGPPDGSKPRQVLYTSMESLDELLKIYGL